MKKATIWMICILLLASLLGGCASAEIPAGEVPETTAVYPDSFGEELVIYAKPSGRMKTEMTDVMHTTLDWVVATDTHIVDAEFLGYHYGVNDELVFRVIKTYKGSFAAKNEVIYVQELNSNWRLDPGEEAVYEIGKQYMLFLEKFTSVYYHDLYGQCGEIYLPETDEDWEKIHKETQELLNAGTSRDQITAGNDLQTGIPYTDSTEINAILRQSSSVFVVEPESVFLVPEGNITTVYRCKVTQTITGTPNNNGSILIPFFNDTVEIGEKYIVMLNSGGTGSEVYALASMDAVFALEEAAEVPELSALLEEAVDYSAVEPEN